MRIDQGQKEGPLPPLLQIQDIGVGSKNRLLLGWGGGGGWRQPLCHELLQPFPSILPNQKKHSQAEMVASFISLSGILLFKDRGFFCGNCSNLARVAKKSFLWRRKIEKDSLKRLRRREILKIIRERLTFKSFNCVFLCFYGKTQAGPFFSLFKHGHRLYFLLLLSRILFFSSFFSPPCDSFHPSAGLGDRRKEEEERGRPLTP